MTICRIGLAGLAVGIATTAQGAVIVTATEVGGNVVFEGSGTLNIDAWTFSGPIEDFARIDPSVPTITIGPEFQTEADRYIDAVNYVRPDNFGPGNLALSTSGSGDHFGLLGINLNVPRGYVSGAALSGMSTYEGATFESLGIELGTYVWTWGEGPTADSFTLNVIPAPASLGLLALGGLLARRRRR